MIPEARVVRDSAVPAWERRTFHEINDLPGALYPLLWPFQQLGALLIAPVVALVAVLLHRRRLALAILVAMAAKLVLERVVKLVVTRERPGTSIGGDVHLRGDVSASGESFVSGHAVLVLERNAWFGGGVVTRELTRPGFRHDQHSMSHIFIQGNPLLLNDAGSVRAFEFLQSLWTEGLLARESLLAKYDTQVDYLQGEAAWLAPNWPFTSRVFAEQDILARFQVYAGWRGPARAAHVLGGDVLGIPRGVEGRRKEAALALARALMSRETQAILVEGNRSAKLEVQKEQFEVPIGNTSWSDDAIVELTYAAPAEPAAPATETAGETPRTAP